ncbi:uncharacterized protein BO96DRAFT_438094 [Aspergillus niger CBS 101883]|uniref:Uncharacterized protein n=2 Tax=Aspergillus niger TaxID=5061 RepID=A2Q7R9_ASPNC|nr:uncharacterized protein BO96DRAFT_438094 [Aspergillus niger CBS 101883]XP_059603079.1 hypothetical protein An01g01710 [Aspergillus niger]PYH52292.1 hypothetical protein BO96DRAFT_438094 [Aspergillus niger CBS 101883]CAK43542.1 hypothetical protein An01g01710 [Aspergillus niger]
MSMTHDFNGLEKLDLIDDEAIIQAIRHEIPSNGFECSVKSISDSDGVLGDERRFYIRAINDHERGHTTTQAVLATVPGCALVSPGEDTDCASLELQEQLTRGMRDPIN